MTDINKAYSLRPAGPSSLDRKQRDLKIRNMLALRAKHRKQMYHNKIKRRKHARIHLESALKLSPIAQIQTFHPGYKTNIHSLFYVKPEKVASQGYGLRMHP